MTTATTVAHPTDSGADPLEDGPLTLTIDEVAEHLRLRPWKVYKLCDAGDIPSIYIGHKTRRVKRSDLIAYINGRPTTRPRPSTDD